ncbi:zinc finger protein 135-like isoform X3 [Rhinatrema bivittatum]|uniref:zinc finger protein 135-like isoform X3 n=1 Tax=Rhinatrema bivittatum TaxID=194408 RepID=UPI00112A3445|nr:zinc finger protein 135-like isoform X3 [Rhinatrema bivittatum]
MKNFPEKHEMPVDIPQKPTVTFNAVTAYFSEAAWEVLEEWRKELYRSVVQEIHRALRSLGYNIVHPDVLLRIKGQEELYVREGSEIPKDYMASGCSDLTPDLLLRIKVEDDSCRSDHQDLDRGKSTLNPDKGLIPGSVTDSLCVSTPASDVQAPDPLLSLEQEEESCFNIQPDLEEGEALSHPSTDHPIITSVFSLSVTDELPYPQSWPQMEQKCSPDTPSAENGARTTNSAKKFPEDSASAVRPSKFGAGAGPRSGAQGGGNSWKEEQPLHIVYVDEEASIWPDSEKTFDSYPSSAAQQELSLGKVLGPDSQHLKSFGGNPELRTDQGQRPFRMTACERNLPPNPKLKGPMRVSPGDRLYRCTECGKGFGQSMDLRAHERVHVVQKPYKCAQCGKGFSQGIDLKIHLSVHAAEKPYRCAECGRSFGHSLDLKVHERIHAAARPYKCGLCEKSFGDMAGLLQHKRSHAGDLQHLPSPPQQARTYKFIEYRRALAPRATHPKIPRAPTAERPFPCAVCGKSFGKKHNLKVHERTHTGERPYACTECGKRFIHKHHLIKHHRVHRA